MSSALHKRTGPNSSNGSLTQKSSSASEILASKHIIDKPAIAVYPLNDRDDKITLLGAAKPNGSLTYPDFSPWKDGVYKSKDKRKEDTDFLDNSSHLNKGYFEPPVVANEYYSARNLVQATLFSSTENCNRVLKELSLHLGKAYSIRNEQINRIRHSSHSLRVPPRVTLTPAKRELWLKDLADLSIPLSKVADKIPHGLRNKALIDAMCNKRVPLQRAMWLTKCVLFGELVALRKRSLSRSTASRGQPLIQSECIEIDKQESHWLHEWTQQVSDYILRFSKEMSLAKSASKQHENEDKMNYLILYVLNLYIECILDKNLFVLMMIKILKLAIPISSASLVAISESTVLEIDSDDEPSQFDQLGINYGQVLTGMTFIQVFWKDISKLESLSKELVELLLLLHLYVQAATTYDSETLTSTSSIPRPIVDAILETTCMQLTYSFDNDEKCFIIPTYWEYIKDTLYQIILTSHGTSSPEVLQAVRKKLDLISFRVESVIRNNRESIGDGMRGMLAKPSSEGSAHEIAAVASGQRRAPDDLLQILLALDRLQFSEEFGTLLRPPEASERKGHPKWRLHLRFVLGWCVSRNRDLGSSEEAILMTCHFLKSNLLLHLEGRSGNAVKIQIENEILDSIFNLCDQNDPENLNHKLYVLMNELLQLKVVTISSYVRKLIASGIFYSSDNFLEEGSPVSQKLEAHLNVLRNMPMINNKQCDSIMKKYSTTEFDIRMMLEDGKSYLSEAVMNPLLTSDSQTNRILNFDNMNRYGVGIRFLLMNWLTATLKFEVSNSPKLIRVTPAFISTIYDLYATCDSLSIFFKVVVKFILQNKGGMLIYYLDTLYLLARLVMRHFKLILSMSDNLSAKPVFLCSLFGLLASNYQDLQNREYDYFNFATVWKFINGVTKKRDFRNESDNGSQILSSSIKSSMFTPSDDSPAQLRTPGTDDCSPGHGEKANKASFPANYKDFVTMTPPLLSSEELEETIGILPSISAAFITSEIPEDILQLLFAEIMESECKQDTVIAAVKLCKHVSRFSNEEGTTQISAALKRHIQHQSDAGTLQAAKLQYLLTILVVYEIISIDDCFNVLSILQSCGDPSAVHAVYDLILGSGESGLSNIRWHRLLLEIYSHRHWKPRAASCVKLCKVLRDMSPLSSSSIFARYRSQIQRAFYPMLLSDTKLTSAILRSLPVEDAILLLDGCGTTTIALGVGDILGHPQLVSEFSLAKSQSLLGIFSTRDDLGSEHITMKENMEVLVNTFVDSMRFGFDSGNLYFGELFQLMAPTYQICVLNILERRFFEHTYFHSVEEPSPALMVSLSSVKTNENLLPVFDDYFRKFPSEFGNLVTADHAFYTNSLKFLTQLVGNAQGRHIDDEGFRLAVSSFLQILIIHRRSLPSLIIEHGSQNLEFVRMLEAFLSSPYLQEDNQRARILLLDFLSMLKEAITGIIGTGWGDGNVLSPLFGHTNSYGGSIDALDRSSKFLSAELDSILTLDDEELNYGGDVHSINARGLMLRRRSNGDHAMAHKSLLNGVSQADTAQEYPYTIKSFEILEDTGHAINNSCINLQLLDCYVTRENPP